MEPTAEDERIGTVRALWRRFATWLGIDRPEPVDLLTVDDEEHFKHWDRDLPSRYMG